MLTAPLIAFALAASQAPATEPPEPSPRPITAGDVQLIVALPWTDEMRNIPSQRLAESALAFVQEYPPKGPLHVEVADAAGGGHQLLLRGSTSAVEHARDQVARWKRSLFETLTDPSDRINIAFSGGTLTQFIDAVKQASGFENILIDGDAGQLLVPPISLRGVSLDTLMDNLEVTRMTGPDGSPKPRYAEVLKIEAAEPVPGGRGQLRSRVQVYRVFEQAPPTTASKVQDIKVYRWNLQDRPIKDKDRAEDQVRSAINMACLLAGFSDEDVAKRLKLAIHLPSGLLIVSAPIDMLPIADTVVRAGFAPPAPAGESPSNAAPDAR